MQSFTKTKTFKYWNYQYDICETFLLIDNIRVQVIQFENLREFIKPSTAHYVLKYEIDEEKAVYYTIADGSNFALLAFCIDKNFKTENVKIEGDRIIEATGPCGTTVVLANVVDDTFLEAVLDEYFNRKSEERKKKKPKK